MKEINAFCKQLPKVELHAHLNGSLSSETLTELHKLQKSSLGSGDNTWQDQWEIIIDHGEKRTLEECFKLFGVAHSLTNTPAAVFKATQDVIKEFANDGVVYLELRSTPRSVPGVMSKTQYIQAMVDGIRDVADSRILVKLLVSFDRKQGKEAAIETLNVAIASRQQAPDIIVGIDLSGDPAQGQIDDYLPILDKARNAGLRISIHCAEIPHPEEVLKILEFHPDRLGHCTCIHPQNGGSEHLWTELLNSHIPVELCLTSNIKCGTVKDYKDHHFIHLFNAKHPIAIATDDKGVFATTLSEEYVLLAEHYNLSREQLWQITLSAIDNAFGSEEEKKNLKDCFQQMKNLSEN